MGAEAKLKAEVAGGKEGKPPAGYSGGKVNRLRKGQAPPPGAWFAPFPSAARVQPQGTCMARSVRAADGSGQGCRGR